MHRGSIAVQIFDIGNDAALIMKFVFGAGPFVMEKNFDIPIQKGEFPQSVLNNVVFEFHRFGKDLRIRLEGNGGAGELGLIDLGHRTVLDTPDIALAARPPRPF